MRILIFILLSLLVSGVAESQYVFRGRVFSEVRNQPITFGTVRLPSPPGTGRHGKTVANVDSLGYFTAVLKDSANVTLIVDCILAGRVSKTVSYSDTLILFNIKPYCPEYTAEKATQDIKAGTITLLCQLGYATYEFNKADSAFSKKYNVTYHTFADEPINYDCMWLYNRVVAEYLDKKYGDSWRKEVRWDVPM